MLLRSKTTIPVPSPLEDDLARRMKAPQRYRLLQGYPMPQMMPEFEGGDALAPIRIDHERPLIVGVLPHTSCAPALPGCGFCTFPHEPFQVSRVRATAAAVAQEIARAGLSERRVDAVYFGGGTANLTPPESLEDLCKALTRSFALEEAEVTLEGAPAFFNGRSLEVLKRTLPTSRLRISMGIQSFEAGQLKAMGRQALGDHKVVSRVVDLASVRGFTTSGDFLINLPGQSLEEMLKDARLAVNLGLDQICLYHLVLFRGLGTPWSRDRAKLKALPDLDLAQFHWNEVRRFLLARGYVQASLTNFERLDVHLSKRRYIYEDCSFHPESYDAVGFGPAALSTWTDLAGGMALKTMNEPVADVYASSASPVQRRFLYGERDLKLLYLTRKLSRLSASRKAYSRAYGGDPVADFPEEMGALCKAGLLEVSTDSLRLTTDGMFYADAVAGLLASRRVRELRLGKVGGDPNASLAFPMG